MDAGGQRMSEESYVAQWAALWLSPIGTVAPAGPLITMPTGWANVGNFTPDSLKFKTSPKFEEARSHQSNYVTRTWQSEDGADLEVDLQDWTAANFKAVFGGGQVTTITPSGGGDPYYKYVPPTVGERVNIAACIEIRDGTRALRRVVPTCMQSDGVEQNFDKTKQSLLPLKLKVLGSDLGPAWYDMSNLPTFDPA